MTYRLTGDYGLFRSNAPMVHWPTMEDLLDWMNNADPGGRNTSTLPKNAEVALRSATSRIAERCLLQVDPEDWVAEATYVAGYPVFAAVPVGTATAGTVGSMALWTKLQLGTTTASFDAGEEKLLCFIEEATKTKVPPEIHQAVLIQAFAWYRRYMSPDGATVGSDQLGGALRQSRMDSTVEALIANHIVWGLA